MASATLKRRYFVDRAHGLEPSYVPFIPKKNGNGGAVVALLFACLIAAAIACFAGCSGCGHSPYDDHYRRHYDRYSDCWQEAPVQTVNHARS